MDRAETERGASPGQAGPETTVLIRTYNEEKHLPQLIQALGRQKYRDFEVLVVDSGSTDNTRTIASAAGRLVRIESRNFTFGYSLNFGVDSAQGRFIAIVSAHALPTDEGWLEALIAPLRDSGVAMTYGRQTGLPSASKFSESRDFDRSFGPDPRRLEFPDIFANNANSAIRKDLWEDHRFDETLPGLEDIAWARHWADQGLAVVYEPRANVFHIHEESWSQIEHRFYREAVAERRIGISGKGDAGKVILRETARAASDLLQMRRDEPGRTTGLLPLVREILGFRYHKALGTMRGLLDGRVLEELQGRKGIYFDREYSSVQITHRNKAVLRTTPIPGPRPGDVLVRVVWEGICGTDLEILDGTLGYYQTGMAEYPIVPGHECSGIVAVVGARVTSVREGDRVVVECIQGCGQCEACGIGNAIGCKDRTELGVIGRDGGYGEYLVVEDRFLHRVPDGIPLRRAALCEPTAVVVKGLRRLGRAWPAHPEKKKCLIVGGGSIGHLAAKVLRHWGHEVTVVDRNPHRLEFFEATGINTEKTLDTVSSFPVVVEATGSPDALHAVLEGSPPGATVLLLGLPYAPRPFNFEEIVAFDRTVVGSVGSGPADFEEALGLLRHLDLDSMLGDPFPLDRFQDAWSSLRGGRTLKVMIRMPVAEVTTST